MDVILKASEIPPDLMQYFEPVEKGITDVWHIPTQPYKGSHFATFPEELIRKAVLSSTPDAGVCAVCGAPWARVMSDGFNPHPGSSHDHTKDLEQAGTQMHESGIPAGTIMRERFYGKESPTTIGWRPTCSHQAEAVPSVILDPFGGSGTSAVVARSLGRRFVLCELSSDYVSMALKRLTRTQPAMVMA